MPVIPVASAIVPPPGGGAGAQTADSGGGGNGVVSPTGEIDKTVLVKSEAKPMPAPLQRIGPNELVWPGSDKSEVKAPPPTHE